MSAIGFIGLGNQGAPIARRIAAAGLPLVVWARRPEVAGEYVALGARAAATIAELGAACRHVGICVVDDAGVREVCDALLPAMAPGSLLAIHSTILPETTEELARACAARGLLFVDAPVSGGAKSAEEGTLTVMCGATPEAFVAARPVFEAFGRHIVLLGGVGSGQRAKIVNNALMSANLASAWAALAAGEALGIDRAALAEVIGHSSGRSAGVGYALGLPGPHGFFGAALLLKDINLLRAILPDNANAAALDRASRQFLLAALAPPEGP